jgi:hypothetical protein
MRPVAAPTWGQVWGRLPVHCLVQPGARWSTALQALPSANALSGRAPPVFFGIWSLVSLSLSPVLGAQLELELELGAAGSPGVT